MLLVYIYEHDKHKQQHEHVKEHVLWIWTWVWTWTKYEYVNTYSKCSCTSTYTYTSQRSSSPLLELQCSYILFLMLNPFFGLHRSKKSFQALPDVWGREKKHSKQPNSSFTVSTAKLPPGPPRNRSKAYEVNIRGWWCCTTFVSTAVFPKLSNLEDFSGKASWKKIGS